jgi:hypothetical protein
MWKKDLKSYRRPRYRWNENIKIYIRRLLNITIENLVTEGGNIFGLWSTEAKV